MSGWEMRVVPGRRLCSASRHEVAIHQRHEIERSPSDQFSVTGRRPSRQIGVLSDPGLG